MTSAAKKIGFHPKKVWLCVLVLLAVFSQSVLAQSTIETAITGNAQDRYPVDWQAVAAESMEYFLALLRTNTSNPPFNEYSSGRTSKPNCSHSTQHVPIWLRDFVATVARRQFWLWVTLMSSVCSPIAGP